VRIGIGHDIHPLAFGKPLILGGLPIPQAPKGPRAFSDGDVAAHAVIDALFGAAGLGDIGQHFPPGDERFRGASGPNLLERCQKIITASGYSIINVDCTIFLEQPNLSSYKNKIAAGIAQGLSVDPLNVNIKAASMEKMGPVGEGNAIMAQAVVLIETAQ
jgi:2-C-methyl-D-erythritol 2,4-cyclodiphosphate synthase